MKQNLTLEALRQLLERRDMCALRDALTQTHPADLGELLDELERYSWEESGRPEDGNDHCINAEQYAWMAYLEEIG